MSMRFTINLVHMVADFPDSDGCLEPSEPGRRLVRHPGGGGRVRDGRGHAAEPPRQRLGHAAVHGWELRVRNLGLPPGRQLSRRHWMSDGVRSDGSGTEYVCRTHTCVCAPGQQEGVSSF